MRQAINSCIIIIFLVKCSFSSRTHKHVLKHTYTYTYTCKLTGYATHSLSFTRSHLYTYTQSLLHKHTKSHTLIQTHTNIHKRTNTHTHTHTHTHTIGSCREGGLKLMLCTTAFSKNSGVLSGVDDVYGNIALCAKLPGLTSSGESVAVKKLVGSATAVTACGFIDVVSQGEEAPPVVLLGSPVFSQCCTQSKPVLGNGPIWRHPKLLHLQDLQLRFEGVHGLPIEKLKVIIISMQ